MAKIHSTAIIAPEARLPDEVEIGPYTVIGPNVEIGSGTSIGTHAVITGHTQIGKSNRIFHFVSLGEAPQDKKYAGEPTRLEIGDNNTIREFCTFNTGTIQDVGVTRVGDDNWIMAYVHIAHDCQIGSHTIFANNTTLGGHVEVGDHAILGGFTAVHQFCRLGEHCFTAFGSGVSQDVPPYVMAAGPRAEPNGINSEGLRRRGFSSEAISAIKKAYKVLYRSGLSLEEAKLQLEELAKAQSEVEPLLDFIRNIQRGIIR
jgi:UDP-N-acetylglucosamine acyltransferase